eukprot:SAG11_NODE_7356_length_1156_cov_1.663198_1_plen_118_part_00
MLLYEHIGKIGLTQLCVCVVCVLALLCGWGAQNEKLGKFIASRAEWTNEEGQPRVKDSVVLPDASEWRWQTEWTVTIATEVDLIFPAASSFLLQFREGALNGMRMPVHLGGNGGAYG